MTFVDEQKDGDANTSFFHNQASFLKWKNFISKLIEWERVATAREYKQQIL
jgi:hypothetical protein